MNKALLYRSIIRVVIALMVSILIYRYFDLERGFWITLTTAVVLQPTTGATLRRGVQRLLGTYAGIIIGGILLHFFHLEWQIELLLVVCAFVAFYFQAFIPVNYGIFVIPLTAMIFMLLSLMFPEKIMSFMWLRCVDSTLGALIAIIVTLTVLPFSQATLVNKARIKTINVGLKLKNILHLETVSTDELEKLSFEFQSCLRANRLLFADAVYEYLFNRERWKNHKQFLTQAEKVGQLLLGYQAVKLLDLPHLNQRYHQQLLKELNGF